MCIHVLESIKYRTFEVLLQWKFRLEPKLEFSGHHPAPFTVSGSFDMGELLCSPASCDASPRLHGQPLRGKLEWQEDTCFAKHLDLLLCPDNYGSLHEQLKVYEFQQKYVRAYILCFEMLFETWLCRHACTYVRTYACMYLSLCTLYIMQDAASAGVWDVTIPNERDNIR